MYSTCAYTITPDLKFGFVLQECENAFEHPKNNYHNKDNTH